MYLLSSILIMILGGKTLNYGMKKVRKNKFDVNGWENFGLILLSIGTAMFFYAIEPLLNKIFTLIR